jgi:CBS domain-containing membrane protein
VNSKELLTFLAPPQGTTSHGEKIISGIGGFLGIFIATLISGHYLGFHDALLIGGAMGASAVLLFAVPHSPLAQPWAFVGGHLVSTAVAITVYDHVPNLYAATGLAVGGSILLMAYLRCLHPPGGGTALAIIIGSPATHALGYHYLITPITYNLAVMLAVALLFNNIATRRWYPLSLHQLWSPPPTVKAVQEAGMRTVNKEDLTAAIKEINAVIDVSNEDLERIYALASVHAHMRRVHGVTSADVMNRAPATVAADADLLAVWRLMQNDKAKGVVVVDANRHVHGIITINDFLKESAEECKRGFPQCLIDYFHKARHGHAKPRLARDLMTAHVISVSEETDVIHLLPLFARHHFNHLPVVNADKQLVGMVTLPYLMSVLHDDAAVAQA